MKPSNPDILTNNKANKHDLNSTRAMNNGKSLKRFNDLESQMTRQLKKSTRNDLRTMTVRDEYSERDRGGCTRYFSSSQGWKIILLIALYGILVTGIGGWLLKQYYRIPGKSR